MSEENELLSQLERDALQEIMNIAFGQAAADLTDVIDLYVTLTVPQIDVIMYNQIFSFINKEISGDKDISMIKQFFSGRFSGSSVLIFPLGEGKKLLEVFNENYEFAEKLYDLDVLEKETLIEISNIIMGACVSKIAELLGDVVNYSPPRYFQKDQINKSLEEAFAEKESFAIFFKTCFHFKEFDASGYLFLVCDFKALEWLKKAIDDYLKMYAF